MHSLPCVSLSQNMLGDEKVGPPLNVYVIGVIHSYLKKKSKYTSRTSCNFNDALLRVRAFFHKTVRVCLVYCNFKIGFTCRSTVIFGTLKDGSLLINTLASNICFTYRNMFQNGVNALSKIVDAFLSKKLKISSSSDYPIMFKFC